MNNRTIALSAVQLIKLQLDARVPVTYQAQYSEVLDCAESIGGIFERERNRQAGRSKKRDLLRSIIETWAVKNPAGTENDLLNHLHSLVPYQIEEIHDDEISYKSPDGKSKSAALSGLKDRLFRARRKVRSRKPASAN